MRRRLLSAAAVIALGVTVEPVAQNVSPDGRIRPVDIRDVEVTDAFWRPRIETNRTVTIPHILRQNELTGRVANFAKAARRAEGTYQGRRFNDTDIYKVIEAASYSLIRRRDERLERQIDELIALVGAAQQPDGHVFPARTIDPKQILYRGTCRGCRCPATGSSTRTRWSRPAHSSGVNTSMSRAAPPTSPA